MLEKHDDKEYYDKKRDPPALHSSPVRDECPSETNPRDQALLRKRWENELFEGIYCPKHEWLQKECAYQRISTGTRIKERGMLKLLWSSHNSQPVTREHRHDRDSQCDATSRTPPQHTVGSRVKVLFEKKGNITPIPILKTDRHS